MASMDAQAIYDNFHTHAQGTPGLATAQQTAEELAAKYQDRAVATQLLINGVQTGWKGAASEAAAQGLTPLAVSSLDTTEHLSTGQDIVGRQVGSFHTALSEVQPVPPAPTMQNVITAAATGQNTTPIIDQIAHSYATQASNVVAYSKYVSASQYNTSNLPPITPVDKPNAPVSVATPPPAASATPTDSTHAPRVSGGSPSKTGTVRTTGTGLVGSGSGAAQPSGDDKLTPPPASTSSGSTTTSAASSPVVPPPSQSSPIGTDGGSMPGQGQPVGAVGPIGGGSPDGGGSWPGAAGPVSGAPGNGEGTGTGTGPRSGPGAINEEAGGLGSRLGGGKPGSGGTAAGTNAGGGGAGEEEGPGSRSGAIPRSAGLAEEEALASERGTGSGGMTSSSAAPMGAGRGAGGDRDSEHQRKYVADEDGEELFGFSGRLAPPVMGETPTERAQRHEEEAGRHGGEL